MRAQPLHGVWAQLALVAIAALLGPTAPALATESEYSVYCTLHPHKSYCWDRHHHSSRKHPDSHAIDAADCDQSKDADRSISACTRLIGQDPRDDIAYFNRGVASDEKKDYDNAIADYSKAIQINPDATTYSNRGYAYAHKRDYDRAFADYAKAIELDADYPDVYFNRGNGYDDLRDFDRAIAEYTNAIAINAKEADFFSDRGLDYTVNGEYDRAIADHNAALAIEPGDAQAYDSRGGAYIGMGDYSRAIADYTKAIELYRTHSTAYEHRGYARFYEGDFSNAAIDLTRTLELEDSAYPMLLLFLARSRAGETATPELEANAARLKSQQWPYAVIELYLGRRQADEVLRAAGDAIERCQAQFYIGEWQLLRNNLDLLPARAALQLAAETCPKTRFEYDAAIAELKRLNP